MKKKIRHFIRLGMAGLLLAGSLIYLPLPANAAEDTEAAAATTAQDAAATETTTTEDATGFTAEDLTYRIVIDPGHGGNDSGSEGYAKESKLTLRVASGLKKELEKYENVEVSLTRTKNKWVDLHDRVKIAKERNADLVISLHFDSYSPGCKYDSGSSVIVARKTSYKPEIAVAERRLAKSILSELDDLGLEARGLIRKKSTDGSEYEDGTTADYHAIIRDGMKYSIPSILVEQAFIDNEDDYYSFLATKKKRRKLEKAEATGIARYLGLRNKETGEIPDPVVTEKGTALVLEGDADSIFSLARKKYNIDTERMKSEEVQTPDSETAQTQSEEPAPAAGVTEEATVLPQTDSTDTAEGLSAVLSITLFMYALITITNIRYGDWDEITVKGLWHSLQGIRASLLVYMKPVLKIMSDGFCHCRSWLHGEEFA